MGYSDWLSQRRIQLFCCGIELRRLTLVVVDDGLVMTDPRLMDSTTSLMNLEMLVGLRPDDASLRLKLGLALLNCGHTTRSYANLRRARDLEPQNPDAWAGLGKWFRNCGHRAEANNAFAAAGHLRAEKLAGWTPVCCAFDSQGARVGWRWLGDLVFDGIFFSDTVTRAREAGLVAETVWTQLEELPYVAANSCSLQPTAFIFHVSRCGSSLVTRLLRAEPENLVLSEPDPLNDLLSVTHPEIGDNLRWLRLVVGALGQCRLGYERRYFIKFSSWNLLRLPLIRQAFPEVPCIFLYRDPIETIVSVLRKPTAWLRLRGNITPFALALGITSREAAALSAEEFSARALACFFRAALTTLDDNSLFLNYTELPNAIWGRLAKFVGLPITEHNLDCMERLSRYDSKDIGCQRPFTADSSIKRRQASGRTRNMANLWVQDLYEQAESRRLAECSRDSVTP